MYAVIETGGKQYRVTPGEAVEVETLPGDVGAEVEFGRVLAVVDGDSVKAGSALASARVKGTIAAHGRGEKTDRVQVQAQEAVQAHHRAPPELHARQGERNRRIGRLSWHIKKV